MNQVLVRVVALYVLSVAATSCVHGSSVQGVPEPGNAPIPVFKALAPSGNPWRPSERCATFALQKVAAMTLAEKAGQMMQVPLRDIEDPQNVATYHMGSLLAGGTDFPRGGERAANWVETIDRYRHIAFTSGSRIPIVFGIDAVHGNGKSADATIFPHNIGLGCTRDAGLVRRIGEITALEARGSSEDWVFSPVLAAARDERWGRTYEAFGETPELAAEMGTALIRGLQGSSLSSRTSVLACAKHFAGDGATLKGSSHMGGAAVDRGNVTLDEETFRKLALSQYFPAIEAGVGTVMVSYSSYRGVKMHAHRALIEDVLKGEMGFAGFVVSDWQGIDDISTEFDNNVAVAINAGIDMIMAPPADFMFVETVMRLVPSRVAQARIDDAVSRILTVKCEMGMFDEGYRFNADRSLTAQVGSPEHRLVAREAVQKSIVLLKNDNSALPLKKDMKILVTGSGSDNLDKQCGGWTVTWMGQGSRTTGTSILAAIRRVVGEGNVMTDATSDERADAAVVVVGEDPYAEWHGDRDDLSLSVEDIAAIEEARERADRVIVVLFSGRPMIITELLGKVDAFVAAWLPGTEGDGVADVLFGDFSPTGKLSHSWPRDMKQIPINVGDPQYDPLFPYGYGLSW